MSDLVKWGILIALVISIIVVVTSVPFISYYFDGLNFLGSFGVYAADFMQTVGNVMVYARRLVNNFLPARLVTIVLALTISRKPLYLVIEAATTVIRAIYK